MTAPFPVEQSKRGASPGRDYAAASRKGWENRKRRALRLAMAGDRDPDVPPPAPHADGGTNVREILDRLRAAATQEAAE